MKKLLTLFLFIFTLNVGFSQQLLFEDFNLTNGVLPAGWQSIDNDAPAANGGLDPAFDMWHVEASAITADSVIAASSWLDVNTVPADDWLITPAVSGLTANATLNWKAGSVLGSFLEPYEIYVSTGNTITDFLATTPVYSTPGETAGGLFQRTTSLSSYAGQTIYVAFRLTGQDLYILELDDIEVTNDTVVPPPPPIPPSNDECATSIDVNSSLGLGVGVPGISGPYDNTLATNHATDPTTGFTCFFDLDATSSQAPVIDNSLWFSFVGDGNTYEITSTNCDGQTSGLMITGIGDGPLSGGQPKFVELYAQDIIPDLGVYGLESVNNGGGFNMPEFTFPSGVAIPAGTYLYITGDSAAFNAFFGFNADYYDSPSTGINGDDAVALYENGVVVDVAGDPNMDGSGTVWEYLDGWMYRSPGDTRSATFVDSNWTYSGINVFDNQTTNATSPTPFPNGTYTGPGGINYLPNGDTQFALYSGTCGGLTPVACNEDYANAPLGTFPAGFIFPTMTGVTYYLMVDGWSDLSAGTSSLGQFCMQFTEVPPVVCNVGTVVNPGPILVCPGGTATAETSNDTIPASGGFGWSFSDSQGGTGGAPGGFFISNAPNPYTFDSDLNGTLSGNGLPPLNGTWVLYGVTYSDATDAAGSVCSVTTDSITVIFDSSLGYVIDFQQTLLQLACAGDANGAIVITTTGGTAPYTYLWSNGATTEDLTGLTPGSYSGTITDANGCTLSSPPIPITEPPALGYIIDFQQTLINLLCNGDSNGAIVITTTGGTAPYTFLWSNGATTEDLTGLLAGTYSGTITDANGCILSSPPIPVSEPPSIGGAATVTDETGGASNGSIDFSAAGGTPPFTFLWSNGATTEDLFNIPAGNYTVDVTDDNGCTFTFGPYTVSNTSSSETIEGLSGLTIQPNPTNGKVFINLELEQSMEVELDLFSVSGKLLQSFEKETVGARKYALDLSGYASGVYFVKLRINNQLITKRISLIP